MNPPPPHYLLFSGRDEDSGRWQFVFRGPDGSQCFAASDVEPEVRGERLDLLTVVRALESLDQPSRVTLVGCSPHLRHGIDYGLSEWRGNGWRWEFFGQMVPVRNGDLWQRLDHALRFHEVDWRRRRVDPPHLQMAGRRGREDERDGGKKALFGISVAVRHWIRYAVLPVLARCRGRIVSPARRWGMRTIRSWRSLAAPLRAG